MGFLLADGHFNKLGRISVTLAIQDLNHLELLANFVGVNTIKTTKKGAVSISFGDKVTSDKIKEKFNVNNLKSYSPPILPVMTDDQFLSFMCGYIDGDGCISKQKGSSYTKKDGTVSNYIRNDLLLQVKCHKNWQDSLERFGNRLCRIFSVDESKSKIRIDKKGYLVWRIYGNYLLEEIKKKALTLGIPLMKRKWDKVAR
jgi:hypothetical protein